MDRHTRPYKCDRTGCDAPAFGDAGGLFRHQREVHKTRDDDRPITEYICPIASCPRNTRGFPRRWNLVEHQRRVHRLDKPASSAMLPAVMIAAKPPSPTQQRQPYNNAAPQTQYPGPTDTVGRSTSRPVSDGGSSTMTSTPPPLSPQPATVAGMVNDSRGPYGTGPRRHKYEHANANSNSSGGGSGNGNGNSNGFRSGKSSGSGYGFSFNSGNDSYGNRSTTQDLQVKLDELERRKHQLNSEIHEVMQSIHAVELTLRVFHTGIT
ncbi:MAG: hypothetical protein M1825_003029 [Sarcosagium campestre]|nr:MAG: hypothetical protein M1825_003029 [Sarcosagium campestre]